MSGFEAIGVVLGAYPLIVHGLQLYKGAKNGQDWELLHDQFRTEEIIYVECIQHLLVSYISEAELLQLSTRDRPNQALWNDPSLDRSLRNLLGDEKSHVVLKTLQEMDKLLTTLNEKLKSHEIATERPVSKFRGIVHTMKTILPQATVRESLLKLRELNGRLQRLLTNSTSSGYPAQGRTPKTSPGLPPDVLRRISAQANELHDALYEGYNCECRNGHEASLGPHSPEDLDLTQPFEIVFPVDEDIAKVFTAEDPASPTASTMDSVDFDTRSILTHRRWSHRGSCDTVPSSLGSPGSPPFRGRSFSLSKSSGLEQGGLIGDLCNFIKTLGEQNPIPAPASCLGVLGVKEKKYKVQVTSLDGYTSEPPSLLSLEEYLSPTHKHEVTRKKRMELALALSLAILQFYRTPWIDMWWTWKDFCVLKGDKSQIFVTKRFYSSHSRLSLKAQTHAASTSAFWECFGEPVLTRLGFALVELALGQRLSELRLQEEGAMQGGDEDMLDLMTAKHLVGEGKVLEEAGQCYHDAVQACLTHQIITGAEVKGLNSEHVNFQLDVERFVVAPIRDSFQASWGLIPKLEM